MPASSLPVRLIGFSILLAVSQTPADDKPLSGRWRPDDEARGKVQLAQGADVDDESVTKLMIIARASGSARTDLLPRPADGTAQVKFTYRVQGLRKATLIVQGLNKNFESADFLTFDLADADAPAAYEKAVRLNDAAASVILRFKVEGQGTLTVENLTSDRLSVQSSIVSGRLGVGPTFDEAADKKPLAAQTVTLNAPKPQTWKQVFIGGAGTVRTIKAHPKDGSIVTGADVSGPFYWDAKQQRPADPTMPTANFPNVPWSMATTAWRPTMDMYGPDNDGQIHTDQLAFDPTDPNVLYFVGGKEWHQGWGVLVTRDKGRTWTHADLKRPDGTQVFIENASSVERLKVDPAHPQTIYYGSRRDGLYHSTDAGKTWSLVENFPEPGTTYTDYGASWIQFATVDGKHTTYVATSPSREDSPFKPAVYASIDDGKTWQKTGLPADGIGLIDPHHGRTLYNSTKKVLKTDVATGQTTDITPDELGPGKGRGWDYSPVAVSPVDPNWLVVFTREFSEGRLFRSRDGGKTWQSFHTHDHRGKNPKMTFQCLPYYPTCSGDEHTFNAVWDACFDPKKPSRLWMATWPGVVMTEDAWAEHPVFRQVGEGHEEVCLFDLLCPRQGALLLSGMMDVGGFVHTRLDMPPATAMQGVQPEGPGGQRAPSEITSLDSCEAHPQVIAAGVCWRYTPPPDGNGTGHARLSRDGGKTWHRLADPPGASTARDGRIAVAAQNPDNLVWMPRMDANVGVFHSKDAGQSWQPSRGAPTGLIWPDLVFSFYKPLAADKTVDGQFYIYDQRDGRFYRSSDGGATFKHVSRLPVIGDDHTSLQRIAAAPGQTGEVWAALDHKGLCVSHDCGDSWTQLQGVARAIDVSFGPALTAGGPMSVYFLGRMDGETDSAQSVYRSDDDGKTWTRIDTDALGWAVAVCIAADRRVPGRVFVGTNGRGIYYAEPTPAR